MQEGATWADVGARNRADFIDQCQDAWDRTSAELTTSDLGEAVQICGDGRTTLEGLTCDEVRVIFSSR